MGRTCPAPTTHLPCSQSSTRHDHDHVPADGGRLPPPHPPSLTNATAFQV